MTKPTREEVLTFVTMLPKLHTGMIEEDWVLQLAKAYLTQEEELKQNCQHIMEMGKQLGILKTENQAQEEELINERLRRKQEYWEEITDECEWAQMAWNHIGWVIRYKGSPIECFNPNFKSNGLRVWKRKEG